MDQIRPFPPTDFIDQAEEEEVIRLVPAVDLKEWMLEMFVYEDRRLYNSDHDHIAELIYDNEEFLALALSAAVAS